MAAMQRTKGASGERELAGLLRERLGVSIARKLDQPRGGGYDLDGIPNISLEVKRYQDATESDLKAWWGQAENQADSAGLIPALAYRLDRRPWKFLVPIRLLGNAPARQGYEWTAAIGIEPFCELMREMMGPA